MYLIMKINQLRDNSIVICKMLLHLMEIVVIITIILSSIFDCINGR